MKDQFELTPSEVAAIISALNVTLRAAEIGNLPKGFNDIVNDMKTSRNKLSDLYPEISKNRRKK